MAIIPPGVEVGGKGLVRTSNLQVDTAIEDLDPIDTVVYPSLDVLDAVLVPVIITPGAGPVTVKTFNLPPGLRFEGGFYVAVKFDATITGSTTSQLAINVSESTGAWNPFAVSGLIPPGLKTGDGQVTYFICPLDAGIWTPASAAPGTIPPVGNVLVNVVATCDVADLMTVNEIDLCGTPSAALPIRGPVF